MGSKVYGYCRVSTMKQSIERQIRNVKAVYPDAVIVVDEYTVFVIFREIADQTTATADNVQTHQRRFVVIPSENRK